MAGREENKSVSADGEKKKSKVEFDTFSAFPFLHLATRLIMELAVNSEVFVKSSGYDDNYVTKTIDVFFC